jgi:hypothetical protein
MSPKGSRHEPNKIIARKNQSREKAQKEGHFYLVFLLFFSRRESARRDAPWCERGPSRSACAAARGTRKGAERQREAVRVAASSGLGFLTWGVGDV